MLHMMLEDKWRDANDVQDAKKGKHGKNNAKDEGPKKGEGEKILCESLKVQQ